MSSGRKEKYELYSISKFKFTGLISSEAYTIYEINLNEGNWEIVMFFGASSDIYQKFQSQFHF
jgi:hypothetical protein